MRKIIIVVFLVLVILGIGGKLTFDLLANEASRNTNDFVDKTDTSQLEEALENKEYENLEWGYDDISEWNEDVYQAQGGGTNPQGEGQTDPQGGYFLTHTLDSFVTDSDNVEVKEAFFVSHMADIYLNAPSYLGKKIKYQGMFFSQYDEKSGKTYKYVLRYGPGCCAYDDQVGLEIFSDVDLEDKTWVEVEGTLGEYQGDQYKHLALEDVTIEEKEEERGLETVLR